MVTFTSFNHHRCQNAGHSFNDTLQQWVCQVGVANVLEALLKKLEPMLVYGTNTKDHGYGHIYLKNKFPRIRCGLTWLPPKVSKKWLAVATN